MRASAPVRARFVHVLVSQLIARTHTPKFSAVLPTHVDEGGVRGPCVALFCAQQVSSTQVDAVESLRKESTLCPLPASCRQATSNGVYSSYCNEEAYQNKLEAFER